MCFYIRDEGRGRYKEGTERKQERKRGAQRDGGEGAVKRNCEGRQERGRRQRQSGERPRVGARDRDKRRRERRERGQPPLLPRVVTPNAGDISTNQITPRAPPFIIILLVFPLLHPHWMTFPGPYRGTKKGIRSQKRTPCFLPGSSVLRYPPGTLLGPAETSSRGEPSPADLLPVYPLHVQRWNLYTTL